ncbi:MAG: phosphate ABC transporter permease PstA [Planctomycetota bacterium]
MPPSPPGTRFRHNPYSRQNISGIILSAIVVTLTVIACVPLFSVLIMLAWRGGERLLTSGIELFTQLPPTPLGKGGGFGNAVVGTLVMVGIAVVVSVPIGILTAIYLSEFGRHSRLATIVRFAAKVLTGLPSILAGVFAYAVVVATMHSFSAFAGGLALALLMVPIVVLTAEEGLRTVSGLLREAGWGVGATNAQVVLKIVLPNALPTVLTGVMLAIARAAGETAPLLFTALASNRFWVYDSTAYYMFGWAVGLAVLLGALLGYGFDLRRTWALESVTRRTFRPNHFRWTVRVGVCGLFVGVLAGGIWAAWTEHMFLTNQPTASMAVFIYNASKLPWPNYESLAWACSLVLVLLVLAFNVVGQLVSARRGG